MIGIVNSNIENIDRSEKQGSNVFGVENLTENESRVIKELRPETAIYPRIGMTNVKVDIEIAKAKITWSEEDEKEDDEESQDFVASI